LVSSAAALNYAVRWAT